MPTTMPTTDCHSSKSSHCIQWMIFIVVLILDQFTKILALKSLNQESVLEVIPGLFNLTLVFNPGAAFGMFADLSDDTRRMTLLVVTALALGVVWLIYKEIRGDRFSEFALAGILAGAIGNLIDRFRFDAVVDFLDFYISSYHWPAFNIADSAICIGVGVLMFRMLFILETPETPENIR